MNIFSFRSIRHLHISPLEFHRTTSNSFVALVRGWESDRMSFSLSSSRNINDHAYQNAHSNQQYHRVEMIISQNNLTPTLANHLSRHVATPQTEPMAVENTSSHPVVAHPRQQHRRSRSLSEVWLEHRPQGTIPTGCHSLHHIVLTHLSLSLSSPIQKRFFNRNFPKKSQHNEYQPKMKSCERRNMF